MRLDRTLSWRYRCRSRPVNQVQCLDEVLETFLLMANRRENLSAKILVDVRDTLAGMLETIAQLQDE